MFLREEVDGGWEKRAEGTRRYSRRAVVSPHRDEKRRAGRKRDAASDTPGAASTTDSALTAVNSSATAHSPCCAREANRTPRSAVLRKPFPTLLPLSFSSSGQ